MGQVIFSRRFKIVDHTNVINLLSNITDVEQNPKGNGYVELYSKNVRLYKDGLIKASKTFIYANDTIHLLGGKIESTVKNECEDSSHDMYKCLDFDKNRN